MQRAPRIKKKKIKKSAGFDDEIVLCGPVFDVVNYKDGEVTEKEKRECSKCS